MVCIMMRIVKHVEAWLMRRDEGRAACEVTKGFGGKHIDTLRTGKASIVNYPKTTVLLPGKTEEKMIFGINIIAKRAGPKKYIEVAAVRELA